VLSPLLIVVAIAIKLDSSGPILFRQHRYGFNQQPFRMFKFRSMHTLEDDSKLTLVSKDDVRVTRVGKFIRAHNIDELPQLINVLRGEMSLVGPRPHALAIDQMFERRIALYARRHNVKPGITGWAQINGFRGGMGDERMRARVEHDLYYIDHWSMWLDVEIAWLTLTSKKAYTNAF
jgi:putative colanic acid biosynthesis UDP-glucose lipid carrier transferase